MEEKKLEEYTVEDYNNIPVCYCKNCLSLRVKIVGGYDFCDDCGCTSFAESHIEEWEKLYESRYGKKFSEEVELDYYSKL